MFQGTEAWIDCTSIEDKDMQVQHWKEHEGHRTTYSPIASAPARNNMDRSLIVSYLTLV